MIKLVEIKNRKNKTLRGVLTLPDDIENPFIVLNLHGFGGSMSDVRRIINQEKKYEKYLKYIRQ